MPRWEKGALSSNEQESRKEKRRKASEDKLKGHGLNSEIDQPAESLLQKKGRKVRNSEDLILNEDSVVDKILGRSGGLPEASPATSSEYKRECVKSQDGRSRPRRGRRERGGPL